MYLLQISASYDMLIQPPLLSDKILKLLPYWTGSPLIITVSAQGERGQVCISKESYILHSKDIVNCLTFCILLHADNTIQDHKHKILSLTYISPRQAEHCICACAAMFCLCMCLS